MTEFLAKTRREKTEKMMRVLTRTRENDSLRSTSSSFGEPETVHLAYLPHSRKVDGCLRKLIGKFLTDFAVASH